LFFVWLKNKKRTNRRNLDKRTEVSESLKANKHFSYTGNKHNDDRNGYFHWRSLLALCRSKLGKQLPKYLVKGRFIEYY